MIKYQCTEQDVLDMNIVNIIAERDAAIEERNQALLERRKVLDERRVAIAQRNLAIKERNDAVLERDNAFTALQQSMNEPLSFETQHLSKRLTCNPVNHVHASSNHLNSGMEILNALCKTMVTSESSKSPQAKTYSCPSVRPRKRKRIGEGMHKKADKLKNVWNTENLGLNKIDFDASIMPVPGCSCTGTFRHCYKWGNGGWQSCCCTTAISAFPLPPLPNKRSGRMGGRKMTGSAFSKLLTRLAMEGFDYTQPVDLKGHWSKHGTNRYVTIK